ncbi:phage portal protein [Ureibacillus chungkukjangi]|uniref:phage portal protein n=1 Tax=Ureibacillus chungkukjangi TaxID=1202712 RepID=UPI00384DE2AF
MKVKMNVLERAVNVFRPNVAKNMTQNRVLNSFDGQGYGRHAASSQKTSLKGWITSLASPLEDIERNIEKLRERSRDLYMGAPIASGALKTMTTNVIGSGLKLNSTIDYEFLNMTIEQADVWETTIEREFALWSESKNCDASRMADFDELQFLAFLSMLMSGDAFALLPYKKRAGTPYQLTVQILEADRVCNPNLNAMFDTKIVNGVEVDSTGEVTAYHVADKHPKSLHSFNNSWQRIEKFGNKSGRPNILHLVRLERPEQRRGIPILAPVVDTLKQITRYSDAELMAAVISGMYTLFVTSESPEASEMGSPLSPNDEIDFEDDDDSDIQVGNGAVNFLREGEKIQESNPGRPNTAFDGFVTSMFRQIGVALEIPYEVLMKHFTSSYSASRGALLEAWKMFKTYRKFMARNFCQPIYEEFLAEAIATGRIYAPGFFSDPIIRKAYCSAEWNGPTQGQLDPLKEAQAAELRVQSGFSTRTREAMEMTGTSYFENHALRIREESVRRRDRLIAPVVVEKGGEKEDED